MMLQSHKQNLSQIMLSYCTFSLQAKNHNYLSLPINMNNKLKQPKTKSSNPDMPKTNA